MVVYHRCMIVLGVYDSTSWFKLKDGKFLPHECRLRYRLECHIFAVILTAMNSGRGWHGHFFCSGPRTVAPAAKTCPHPTTVLQKGQ